MDQELINITAVHGQPTWGLISPSGHALFHPLSRLSSACRLSLSPLTPCQIYWLISLDTSVGCFGLGFILDMKHLSQRRRAQVGLYTVVVLNVGVYIWSIIMQTEFDHHNPGHIDWEDGLYPSSFLPYFFVQTTGPLSQSYMYWLISSFANNAQGEFL